MKLYKMNFKPIIILFIIILGVSFSFVGCKNDSNLVNDGDNQAYLSLRNDNLLNMSEADNLIFAKALKRMEIVRINGEYQTKWTSGSQINISEELFIKIKEIIDSSNKDFNKLNIRSPRLKIGSEGGGTPTSATDTTDCVAQAISMVLGLYNSPITYASVNSSIIGQYGTTGVPLYAFGTVCSQFLRGSLISLNSNTFSNNNGMPPSGQRVIVAMNINGYGHVGVLVTCTGSVVSYADKYGIKFADITQVVAAYQACGY